ncbi:MAG TPA: hypothetical protein VHA06_04385 [Candidatus Angelobacter sp.]|jgi:hypothetical protein|nr:hypothetical protein [Candidatus Angelobacter sp.]
MRIFFGRRIGHIGFVGVSGNPFSRHVARVRQNVPAATVFGALLAAGGFIWWMWITR